MSKPGYYALGLCLPIGPRPHARILAQNGGLPHDRFYSVTGRADAEPLFPEDPFLASNRRISILVMSEAPPLPCRLHKP